MLTIATVVDPFPCITPYRVVTISATLSNLVALSKEIIPYINENQPPNLSHHSTNPDDNNSFAIRILVHYAVAGSVIGTGGGNIRNLRQHSGCQITVHTECCPQSNDRIVLVSGTLHGVVTVVASVLDTVVETQIRGQPQLYNPLFSYDPTNFNVYGGFPPMVDSYGYHRMAPPYGMPPAGYQPYAPPYPYPPQYPPPPPATGSSVRPQKRRRTGEGNNMPSDLAYGIVPPPPPMFIPAAESNGATGGYPVAKATRYFAENASPSPLIPSAEENRFVHIVRALSIIVN